MRTNRTRAPSGALAFAVCCGLGTACSDPAFDPGPGGTLTTGTWGAVDAGVIVSESAAHVHIGCTFGDVDGEIALGPDGAFEVAGRYMLRAYPIAVGPAVAARFIGRAVGRTLTLTVAVDDTVESQEVTLGPVTLTYGDEPVMAQCPIWSVQ